jgi:hypothetical protein
VSTFLLKQVRKRAGARAVDELASRLTGITETGMEELVRRRALAIAAAVDVYRLRHPAYTGRRLDRGLIRRQGWLFSAGGVATSLPGVVPGAGTAVEVAVGLADAARIIYGQITLILGLAHAHGRDLSRAADRRIDVLCVLALSESEARIEGDRIVFDEFEIARDDLRRGELSPEVLAVVNRAAIDTVLNRISKRRAKSFLVRLLPFGLGVVAAARTDYKAAGGAGHAATEYFGWIEKAPASLPSAA